MATKSPVSVKLTVAHRDAIYEEIGYAFDAAGDFRILFERRGRDGREEIERMLCWLGVGFRLLDVIGWEESGDQDVYDLPLDRDVVAFMEELGRRARGSLEDERKDLLTDPSNFVDVYDHDYESHMADTRRLIDRDLDALDAARIVRESVA